MIPMINTHFSIKFHRTRSMSLRRHLNASKDSLTALLGAALSGGTLHSADFFWFGYFDYPISSRMMEAIHNKIGTLTRMASGDRDGDFLHLRTPPSMS
jgi:transposase